MADTAQLPNTKSQAIGNGHASAPPDLSSNSTKHSSKQKGPSQFQKLNQLYALPAPLRTFPLPTLVPHNPLSLFHVLYVWLRQTLRPESSTFDPLYHGWFSQETRSVHVTDHRSVRGLWEQGFYGKGSLSRSEPSWMLREQSRRGTKGKATSEEMTAQRRRERQQVKWERARKEREAIDQRLSEEAQAEGSKLDGGGSANSGAAAMEKSRLDLPVASKTGKGSSDSEILEKSSLRSSRGLTKITTNDPLKRFSAPVGPLELLALPNSEDLLSPVGIDTLESTNESHVEEFFPHGGVAETSTLSMKANCHGSGSKHSLLNGNTLMNGSAYLEADTSDDVDTVTAHSSPPSSHGSPKGPALMNGQFTPPKIKRQKSVRFSPTVEKNTFIQSEPPSPEHAVITTSTISPSSPRTISATSDEEETIKTQEHTQLTLEEAFFLSYALGALTILSPSTGAPIPSKDLFNLFRRSSYFPPREAFQLMPDDQFMVNYVVYHHYRSLGWVPRSGIKFSCDLMLYHRGPVFDHAEFGVIILPSYSDPYWSSDKVRKAREQKTWHWMMCINRVITQVKKTLVLCYVDIPPPPEGGDREMRVDQVLERYKIREVVMKRFSANRMRG